MGFREVLPASLQEIVQNGLLDGVFQDALVASFLYDRLAEVIPWGGQLGSTSIMTRSGLMTPSTTPITGQDATPSTYGLEQYSMRMDQFGDSIDTNMVLSAMALASKYLQDNKTLGIGAAQSLDLVAQEALYAAFGTGATWATAASAGGSSVTLAVADTTGLQNTVVNASTSGSNPSEGLAGDAVPTVVPVSGTNPGYVSCGGAAAVAYTAVSTTSGPGTITFSAAQDIASGAAVVPSVGPVMIRPNGRLSANQLVSGDVATLAVFQSAVTRLRTMHVPRLNGAYTAHIAPQTVEELSQDAAWQSAFRGRADSPAYENFAIGNSMGGDGEFLGRFLGIDWVMNTVTPSGVNLGDVEYWRPIVCGASALIKGPFEEMGSLVSQLNAGATVQVDMINGVARILRAPLDRLGQVLSSTWSWIGGYSVGTDILTGDSAIFKRAVVVEHA